MLWLAIAALLLAGCADDFTPKNATIEASCDCALPDGGLSPTPYVYGYDILCVSDQQAKQDCDSVLQFAPDDAGRADCVAVLSSCQCVIGEDQNDCAGFPGGGGGPP